MAYGLRLKINKETESFMRKFPNEFQNALVPAFEKIMLKAEGKAKKDYFITGGGPAHPDKLTSRTGNLRRSIQHMVDQMGNKVIAGLMTEVEYAATHEYGDASRNIDAREFLTPAIVDVIEDNSFENVIYQEVKRAMEI